MAFDINNFVIDRVIRGVMISTDDGSILWSLSQISNPTLSISSDTVDVNDAIGARIAQFDRAKNATFSGENSLFDLGLYAAQSGTKKQVASTISKIRMPRMETLIYTGEPTIELLKTPIGVPGAEIKYIYALKGDQTMGIKYDLGVTTASATEFLLDGKELTFPTGLTNGSQIFVMYEYEEESGVAVENKATEFPTAGKFLMSVLGQDVCNPSVKYYANILFPNAKLSSSVDVTFSPDSTHPFELTAMQQYCDYEKKLFSILIPDAD